MKFTTLHFFLGLNICSIGAAAQTQVTAERVSGYVEEIKRVTFDNRNVWNMDLYAPILFVDPATRILFANEQDSTNSLKAESGVFRGVLPDHINIANTSMRWSGKNWAMILLPLSDNRYERTHILAHELFHRAQPKLGFETFNIDNIHLDKRDGRIYLRLELEALRKALESSSKRDVKRHLLNALCFRKVRYLTYPGSDATENLLELNEGLAEYTGLKLSGRNNDQMIPHLLNSLREFHKNKTYVRSFAYQTVPIYGYLTSKNVNYFWNKDIDMNSDLPYYFMNAFELAIPPNLKIYTSGILSEYNGERITMEEKQRELDNLKLVKDLVAKFVTGSHLEIPFEKMNVSFNPSNLIPLENYGTVYPTLRITDNWGILTVADGALLSKSWDKVTVTLPTETKARAITGQGWTLELNGDDYIVSKDENSDNYHLVKK